MTDRQDQDRERREEEERRLENERRADQLRRSWRERHPTEDEKRSEPGPDRPKRGKP